MPATSNLSFWEGVLDKHFFTVLVRVPLTIVALLALVFLLGFTLPKLYKTSQIRGWLPGASISQAVITDKASEKWRDIGATARRANYLSYGTHYLVSWNGQAALEEGPDRAFLQKDAWDNLKIGDTIDVIYLADNGRTYTRASVMVSNGNITLDILIVITELLVLGLCIYFIVQRFD